MDWDLTFLIQTSVITICAVVCIPIFIHINKTIPKTISRYFYCLITALFLETAEAYFDHVLSLVPDNRFELARITVSVIGYIVRPLMLYIALLLMTRDSKIKYRRELFAIPSVITTLIALMAFFTKAVFYYDENNQFHGGPLRYVLFIDLYVYLIIILVINIRYRKKDVRESTIIFIIMALLIFDMVIAMLFYEVSFHEQFSAISVLLYFTYFMSAYSYAKVEEMHTVFSEAEQNLTKKMLDQSIETLAYTIDAKDKYTRGHSMRVAKYARMLASVDHKDEETCRQIYLAGLLHDIGKISISDEIINKPGKLTAEEYEIIKTHPSKGAKILEKMKDYPFLQDGAAYHHERFDGQGYPNGVSGTDIPEIGRIIAVADAYDAMTSYRSYRDVMDQADVKQEIWKGAGTQFDPFYAKLMISLIDSDIDYNMREKPDEEDLILLDEGHDDVVWQTVMPTEIKADNQIMAETNVFKLGEFASYVNNWETPTEPVQVTESGCNISFFSKTDEDVKYLWFAPSVIVFSSGNGQILTEDYVELGVFETIGYSWASEPALSEKSLLKKKAGFINWERWTQANKRGAKFRISARREGSIVRLTLENDMLKVDSELVLPDDYDRDIYITVTGERCSISDVVNQKL